VKSAAAVEGELLREAKARIVRKRRRLIRA
jgi:hypothetical protein